VSSFLAGLGVALAAAVVSSKDDSGVKEEASSTYRDVVLIEPGGIERNGVEVYPYRGNWFTAPGAGERLQLDCEEDTVAVPLGEPFLFG
jgi:hypothetical protein